MPEISRNRQNARYAEDTVSVLDFGAVGDGVTDDADAIQAAIDSLPVNSTLFFPSTPNGYFINGTTVPTLSTSGVTVLNCHLVYGVSHDLGGGTYPLLRVEDCDDVSILGGRFVGTGHADIAHNRRLLEIRANTGTVENVLVEGNIFENSTTHSIIVNSSPHDNDGGTSPTTINVKGVKVIGNEFKNGISGILTFMGGCNDIIITNNRFSAMSTLCVKLDSENRATDGTPAGRAVISSNVFSNFNASNSSGTVIADSPINLEELVEDVVISNNVFNDIVCSNASMVRLVGDDISGEDQPASNILIQGNLLQNGNSASVFVIDRSTPTVTKVTYKDNQVADNFDGEFINITSPVTDLIIEGNICQDLGSNSFALLNDNIDRASIKNNKCLGCDYFAYNNAFTLSNITIEGNSVLNLDRSFLFLSQSSPVQKLIVKSNDIEVSPSANTGFHVFQISTSSATNPDDAMRFIDNRVGSYAGETSRRAFALDVGDCDILLQNNNVGDGYDYGVYALSSGNLYAMFNYFGAGANGMRHTCSSAYALGNFIETQSTAQTVGAFTAISTTDVTV